MFNLFRRKREPSVPSDPQAWQRYWHQVLDDYPHSENEPKGVPDPLPDMSSDFRLQFAFWHVGPEARARAFRIFPRGEQLLARVEEHLATPWKATPPESAIDTLRDGLRATKAIAEMVAHVTTISVPDADLDIRITTEADMSLLDAFADAGQPFDDLRAEMGCLAGHATGPKGKDAYYFLGEPLYRISTTYDVAEWISWPLCAAADMPDPTEAAYRLWQGGWSAGWNGKGLFLYDRRWEFGLL